MLSPKSMSKTPLEPPAQGVSSGSVHTLTSRPLQTTSDPSASKRVCFYRSGDYKFTGHRMVINARTFKTFDALLDALSKKVPLPFGVRTITTPRGTHSIKGLEDLRDGGSYVCSDQKRIKPLNLDAVYQRQIPWNTTRPVSAVRRGHTGLFGRRNKAISRTAKITDRVAVRTPKRLVVIKNRDATIKRTIVLQKRTAPTFDALLDYLSQIMQFRVFKLYSADGRRVDGLAGLILCSGVIVAAGNEPFRLGNYNFHRSGQMTQPFYSDAEVPTRLQAHKDKPLSSGRGSRNFSLSSERYIVNQINKSLNGSTHSRDLHHDTGSFETQVNASHTSTDMESCENARPENGHQTCILPQDEDIEKSFRINQDGSMTVEMKVRLSIKEEELLHWTTTLSRSSLYQGTICVSESGSGSAGIGEDESKEENHTVINEKSVGFSDGAYDIYHHPFSEIPNSSFKRIPTPGPPHMRNNASTETIKTMTQSCMQDNTLGHYSYLGRTVDGERTEGFCVVRHTNSSGNRPIPKPRRTASAGTSNGHHSSVNPSGVVDVHQVNNNEMEITKTVMDIYERQDCFDSYLENQEYGIDGISSLGSTGISQSKSASSDTGPHSSSNECNIDFTHKTSSTYSLCKWKEEILSLSSEPIFPTPGISTNLISFTDKEAQTIVNAQDHSPPTETESVNRRNTLQGQKKKKIKPTVKKSSNSTSSSETKQKSMTSSAVSSKHVSADKLSKATITTNTTSIKKTSQSSESGENCQKGKVTETLRCKKEVNMNETTPMKKPSLPINSYNAKGTSHKKQSNINQRAHRDNGQNKNALKVTVTPLMKKNILPGKINRQKSLTENKISSPTQEISESVSMPTLNPTPSDVHQYVENWLQKISYDSVSYIEDTAKEKPELQTTVVFKIGGDSDSDTKSECQNNTEDYYPSPGDAITKSVSCVCIPVSQEENSIDMVNRQRSVGLSVSMQNVRRHPREEKRLSMHKSTEAMVTIQSSASTSNLYSPKAKIKPILRQLCSSIRCIRNVCNEPSISSNLSKANSLPDFSSQVASVFGSSSKALLSFLSVMTLKESLISSVAGDRQKGTSEALLVVESLQKISTIEDEEEQRASLTDLQSRTSSQLREHWRDFQVLREWLESEPMSPKFSEQEFAIDVVSEGDDQFDDHHSVINELMEELNMPQDLREQISSTLQHTKSFYHEVEESTFAQKEISLSEGEEELKQFTKDECDCQTIQSPQPDCIEEDTAEAFLKENNENGSLPDGGIPLLSNKSKSPYHKPTDILSESPPDQGEDQEIFVKDSEPGELETEEKEDTYKGYACGSGKSVIVDRDKQRDERTEGEEVTEVCEDTIAVDEGMEQEFEPGVGDGVQEKVEQTTEHFEDGDGLEQEAILPGEDEDEKELENDDREEVMDNGEEDLGDDVDDKYEGKEEVVSEDIEYGMGAEEHEKITEGKDEKDHAQQSFVENEEMRESEGNSEPEEREVELDKKCDIIEENIHGEEEEGEEIGAEDGQEGEIDEEKDKLFNPNQEEAIAEEEEELKDTVDEVYHEERESNEDGVDTEDEGNVEVQQCVREEEPSESGSAEDKTDDGLDERCKQLEDESERSTSEPVCANANRFARPNVGKGHLEEFLQPHSGFEEGQANHGTLMGTENEAESLRHGFTGTTCGDEKGEVTITLNEHKTDYGGEEYEKRLTKTNQAHTVEISQELLDFVNSALQSSSLMFLYDDQGNIRIEPDNARVIQTKQIMIPQNKKDSLYGLKQLPSPSTSDLSDYRPDTSESGEYNTQESLEIATESGEELSESRTPEFRHARTLSVEHSNSKMSCQSISELLQSPSLKSGESFCSYDSGPKVSKEDLSYFSAASSSKADIGAGTAPCTSVPSNVDLNYGVLIDQGRWLLKENHLIRNSPPILTGMYGHSDTYSVDTAQDNTSVESIPHYLSQQNPLATISSSELEEMAKPQSPKCAYYNMPHGSDSDPFLDDVSIKSRKKYAHSGKARSVKVSPTIDTSKSWSKKNGSLSSFASVEFKMADSKVHPEEESSSVIQATRPSSVRGNVMQAQDSFHLRCGQYCPIL